MSNGMNGTIDEQDKFFPFVRKGIATKITQEDELACGNDPNDVALYRERASVELKAKVVCGKIEGGVDNATGDLSRNFKGEPVISSESKFVKIVGPGDILSINSNAVMNFSPAAGSEAFPRNCFPYIEFEDPDFAWRYTPAAPNGQKLRPWIALVVCETSKCDIQNNGSGHKIVTFKIKDDEYGKIFPLKEEIWKAAHAQGASKNDVHFCRLLGIRREGEIYNLNEYTDYTAFVIPVFEVGRLRGLGFAPEKLKDVVAQAPSWEDDLKTQKDNHPSPLTFPVYYTWNFKTGEYNFDDLVKNLEIYDKGKSGIVVDVTSLGKGLTNESKHKTILMPAATKAPTKDSEPAESNIFPDPMQDDEKDLYDSLKKLLDRNPVFAENRQEIGENEKKSEKETVDDPWVVPPIYGGKHSMAQSFEQTEEWVRQVNLDLRYRAAAGLGKKTIQKYQEEFVNRAWKQVELVQTLNKTLYQKLLSVAVNKSVKGNNYEWMNDQEEKIFVARFMQHLSAMQNVKTPNGGVSLNSILNDKGIPAAFASATFQRVTDRMSKKVENLDLTTLMEGIADRQIFKDDWHPFHDLPTIEQLDSTVKNLLPLIVEHVIKTTLGGFVSYNENEKLPEIKGRDEFSAKFSKYEFGWKKLNIVDGAIGGSLANNFDIPLYHHGRNNLPCYGSTNWYKNPDNPSYHDWHANKCRALDRVAYLPDDINVIGLPDSRYTQLFGSVAPITRLITPKKSINVYFVSVGEVFELRKQDSILKENVKYYGDVGVTTTLSFCVHGINAYEYGVPLVNDFDSDLPGFSFDSVTPDYIKLNITKIDKKYIQTFASPYEYALFVRNSKESGKYTLINEWEKFKKEVELLKQKFNVSENSEQKTISANSTKTSTTTSIQDIKNLKETALVDQTYDRIWNVAYNYYKEFVSNEDLLKAYVEDLLQSRYPIMAYPIFSEPVYYYLREFSDKFILPSIDDISDNSIAMFENNTAFVEAYLCGMNTEMGRELLWREYPTDQRGSYFKKFWDSETDAESIRKDNFFDVKSLHTWTGDLGKNHCEGKDGLLIFAIKGNLIKLYPNTEIYLHKAKIVEPEDDKNVALKNDSIAFGYAEETEDAILRPVAEAYLKDVYTVGFKISMKDALGSPNGPNYGYILTFKQAVEDLAFKSERNKLDCEEDTSATYANNHIDTPSIIGRHVLTFLK